MSDIVFEFGVKPRLSDGRGNAILVASSIYEACKYFALFSKTPFRNKCAVITSDDPQAKDVTKEEVGPALPGRNNARIGAEGSSETCASVIVFSDQ